MLYKDLRNVTTDVRHLTVLEKKMLLTSLNNENQTVSSKRKVLKVENIEETEKEIKIDYILHSYEKSIGIDSESKWRPRKFKATIKK